MSCRRASDYYGQLCRQKHQDLVRDNVHADAGEGFCFVLLSFVSWFAKQGGGVGVVGLLSWGSENAALNYLLKFSFGLLRRTSSRAINSFHPTASLKLLFSSAHPCSPALYYCNKLGRYSQRLIVGGPSRIFSREIVVPKPFSFDSAMCCAINTDRSQIITIDKDCLIQVWDSRSGGGMYVNFSPALLPPSALMSGIITCLTLSRLLRSRATK